MGFEDARALARRLAEVASRSTGEALWLRDYPAADDGDVGRVVIGIAHAGVHRALALVNDLGSMRTITLEVAAGELPALAGRSDPGDDPAALAAVAHALVETAAAVRRLAWPLGVLDAAIAVLDHLGQALAVQGSRWRLATWGEWNPTGAGASVELGGDHAWDHLVQLHADAGGVVLAVPAATMGGDGRTWRVAGVHALVDALPAVVLAIRAAVDGRASFRARPLSAASAAGRIAAALRDAHVVADELRVTAGAGDFPRAWPQALVRRVRAGADRAFVVVDEDAAGVRVHVGAATFAYADLASLAAALPAIARAAGEHASRLAPDDLEPGARYRLLRPAFGQPAGASVRFVDRLDDWRDGWRSYRFATDAGAAVALDDGVPADLEILRHLADFLIRH